MEVSKTLTSISKKKKKRFHVCDALAFPTIHYLLVCYKFPSQEEMLLTDIVHVRTDNWNFHQRDILEGSQTI